MVYGPFPDDLLRHRGVDQSESHLPLGMVLFRFDVKLPFHVGFQTEQFMVGDEFVCILAIQEEWIDFRNQGLTSHAGHTFFAACMVDIPDIRTEQGTITAVLVGIVMLFPATVLADQRAPDSG